MHFEIYFKSVDVKIFSKQTWPTLQSAPRKLAKDQKETVLLFEKKKYLPKIHIKISECFENVIYKMLHVIWTAPQRTMVFEPRHEKTCLQGLRPGKTQTGLRSHRS